MKILNHIKSETDNVNDDIYDYSYSNHVMNYKSMIKGFNENLYSIFNQHYKSLDISLSIKNLFSGEIVNKSENRAALHHAYRDMFAEKRHNFLPQDFLKSCAIDIEACINLKEVLIKKGIKNIVTIGIGGSYEGPKLLIESLISKTKQNFNNIFLTGPDVEELSEKVESLEQNQTFFIISSKSFSTEETLQGMTLAKKWLELKCNFDDHFIAVTSYAKKAKEFGFKSKNIISFPIEVGGRYSIWSPIALSAILELGDFFKDFLIGGSEADHHFLNDKKYKKFIKLISFSDIWHSNFLDKQIRVVLPYCWKMRSFSNYVQQLEMESIGKKPNSTLFKNTGQLIFGGFAPIGQHSYFQLLHQGSAEICADIITIEENKEKNKLLFAQSQVQSSLFSMGKNEYLNTDEQINGNVPTNLFTLKTLSPRSLGYLIATWEHRTFITAKMLEINPFDQYGVIAGKNFVKKYLENYGG